MESQEEKSLKESYISGIFGSCMTGFIQEYITPFLLFMGAVSRHIGILHAAVNLSSSLIQLFSAEVSAFFHSRKKLVSLVIVLQTVILALVVGISYLGFMRPWLFISLIVFFTAAGALSTPAWSSFLSELVSAEKRGDYFGWRNRNLGLFAVGTMFLAGWILERMKGVDPGYGFLLIFFLALICRMLSGYFLFRMEEPPRVVLPGEHFSFWAFFARIQESNFTKFVVFVGLMNFSVNLAAPYFAVLMIRDLSFSYILYTAVQMVAPLILYLTIRRWGRIADRVGNLKIIKMATRTIAVIPLLWVIYREPWYLILVEGFSGFVWAGFSLCTANYIYDAVSPPKRTRCIAYFNVVNGVCLSTGALIGGFLVNKLPPLFGHKILTLFCIASFSRIMVAVFFPRLLREVRTVKEVSSLDVFFRMIGLRPISGFDRKDMRL